jgi:hypothetical protein
MEEARTPVLPRQASSTKAPSVINKSQFLEETVSKSQFLEENGSKNGLRAPRTDQECPHEGPCVDVNGLHNEDGRGMPGEVAVEPVPELQMPVREVHRNDRQKLQNEG